MQLPYSEELNIEYLGRLFDNTTECYKFFWFKAIVTKVTAGKYELTYEELVDEMIADAYFMVTEYHLNLGPKDALEGIVNLIKIKNPALKSCEKQSVIIDFLKNTQDKEIISKKRALTYNVPYRLQSPFMENVKGKEWNVGESRLIAKINQENRLIYYFEALNGLSTKIIVQSDWAQYIIKNQEIYGDNILTENDLSIDHFVPWSYVAHDEMWNLNPTTKSINSSKSNNLPDWNTYFEKLVRQEYQSYQMLWKYDAVHKEFDKCAKEHINNDDIRYRIYRKGLEFTEFAGELETIILPVYQSAKNCGFTNWKYQNVR